MNKKQLEISTLQEDIHYIVQQMNKWINEAGFEPGALSQQYLEKGLESSQQVCIPSLGVYIILYILTMFLSINCTLPISKLSLMEIPTLIKQDTSIYLP